MAKKIRLAYIVSTLGRTGPTRQLYNLVKYLDRETFEPEVITLSLDPPENLSKEFINLDIKLASLGLSRITSAVIGKKTLERCLEGIMPDVIHSQGLRADYLSSALGNYSARISTQRNNPKDDYSGLYGTLIGTLAARLHYRALSKIPTVVACSNAIATSKSTCNTASIVIHNGVDIHASSTLSAKQEKIEKRRTLNLPTDGKLFIYVGPLIRRKNPEILIRAFLNRANNSDVLCLLGSGSLLSACQLLANNAERVFLPGFVQNVTDYISAADLFVSASSAEGMPNAVLEALSMGLPVILSDIPAHREIIDLCPEAGQLFTPSNLKELAKYFDSPKYGSANRSAARQLVLQHFDAKAMSRAYQKIYIESLRKHNN